MVYRLVLVRSLASSLASCWRSCCHISMGCGAVKWWWAAPRRRRTCWPHSRGFPPQTVYTQQSKHLTIYFLFFYFCLKYAPQQASRVEFASSIFFMYWCQRYTSRDVRDSELYITRMYLQKRSLVASSEAVDEVHHGFEECLRALCSSLHNFFPGNPAPAFALVRFQVDEFSGSISHPSSHKDSYVVLRSVSVDIWIILNILSK